jgi:hypothetical protein
LSSTPANGAIDIGNGTGFTRTTLTAGSNISITNGAGSITIAATGGGGLIWSGVPAAYNSAATAGAGSLAYDSNYLYIYNGTKWLTIPQMQTSTGNGTGWMAGPWTYFGTANGSSNNITTSSQGTNAYFSMSRSSSGNTITLPTYSSGLGNSGTGYQTAHYTFSTQYVNTAVQGYQVVGASGGTLINLSNSVSPYINSAFQSTSVVFDPNQNAYQITSDVKGRWVNLTSTLGSLTNLASTGSPSISWRCDLTEVQLQAAISGNLTASSSVSAGGTFSFTMTVGVAPIRAMAVPCYFINASTVAVAAIGAVLLTAGSTTATLTATALQSVASGQALTLYINGSYPINY